MPRSIKYILPIFLLFSVLKADAQYDEIGIMVGASRYKGELSRHMFGTDFLSPAFGFLYRHNWNRRWSWKLEFNFFPYETDNPNYSFTPYFFTGLAIFHFNPMAKLNDTEYELQPLGTEGQGSNGTKRYKRTTIAIPMGGGIKIALGRIGIGLEVGARRAYSDYLDDVSTVYPDMVKLQSTNGADAVLLSDRSFSRFDTTAVPVQFKQRGNASDRDWYMFAGLTIVWRMTSSLNDICRRPFKPRRY